MADYTSSPHALFRGRSAYLDVGEEFDKPHEIAHAAGHHCGRDSCKVCGPGKEAMRLASESLAAGHRLQTGVDAAVSRTISGTVGAFSSATLKYCRNCVVQVSFCNTCWKQGDWSRFKKEAECELTHERKLHEQYRTALTRQIENLETQKCDLISEIQAKDREIETMQATTNTISRNAAVAKEERLRADEDHANTVNELSSLRTIMEESAAAHRSAMNRLEKENSALSTKLQDTEIRLGQRVTEILGQADGEIEEVRAELGRQLHLCEEERNTLTEKLAEANQLMQAATTDSTNLLEEWRQDQQVQQEAESELLRQLTEVQGQRDGYRQALQQAKLDLSELETRNERELQDHANASEAAAKGLKQRLEAETNDALGDVTKLRLELARVSEEKAGFEARVRMESDNAKSLKSELEALHPQLAAQAVAAAELTGKMSAVETQLRRKEEECDEAQHEIAHLRAELREERLNARAEAAGRLLDGAEAFMSRGHNGLIHGGVGRARSTPQSARSSRASSPVNDAEYYRSHHREQRRVGGGQMKRRKDPTSTSTTSDDVMNDAHGGAQSIIERTRHQLRNARNIIPAVKSSNRPGSRASPRASPHREGIFRDSSAAAPSASVAFSPTNLARTSQQTPDSLRRAPEHSPSPRPPPPTTTRSSVAFRSPRRTASLISSTRSNASYTSASIGIHKGSPEPIARDGEEMQDQSDQPLTASALQSSGVTDGGNGATVGTSTVGNTSSKEARLEKKLGSVVSRLRERENRLKESNNSARE